MSSHKLTSGARRFRVSGVLVRNSQPCRSFDHSSVLQRCLVSASLGSSFMASATMFSEPSTPLRCGGESRSIIAAYSVPFTLRSISSGCDIHHTNSCGVGWKLSKCAKIFRGASTKKEFSLCRVGEQRCGQSESVCPLPQLVPGSPVGHPLVQRIENQIAARRSKKVGHVVGWCRRIVHDGCFAVLLDLQ